MNLKTQISAIVATMRSGVLLEDTTEQPIYFRYGRKSDENINGDNESYPAVVLLEPDQMGFKVSSMGQIYDRYNLFLQFIDQEVMGEQASERESKIEAMRSLAAQFIFLLNKENAFNDISESVPGVTVIDTYDVNVVGIEINISLTDTQPRVFCVQ
ncbi:MAG: hypothetical protein K0S09_25 [Sphingobacteriaceae bacterium]|jgi:hypothetical protein|nr:hypothetical protein [Sphingobacteriaceae bacterium]